MRQIVSESSRVLYDAPGSPADGGLSQAPVMQRVLERAARVARTDTTVLILGETGVGKERVARRIHAVSDRGDAPFIALNCAAIPDTLLEVELFGAVRGAYTGADRDRQGLFQRAHRGTLFLDEVAELSPAAQAKLLRALQERTVQPVGSDHLVDVDVRIVAATNTPLDRAVAKGAFRADLFYRLSVVMLTVPPLRERLHDIETLLAEFLRGARQRCGRDDLVGFHPSAIELCRRYSWPGNVRELMNVVEHAVLFAAGPEINDRDLPIAPEVAERPATDGALQVSMEHWAGLPWRSVRDAVLTEAERAYLAIQLRHSHGRVGRAATSAGLTPRSLHRMLRHAGVEPSRFRS